MFRSTAMILAFFGSLLFAVGCGGSDEEGLGTCPPDSAAQQMSGAAVIMAQCLNCHSSTSTDRQGAPADANLDDMALLKSKAEGIYARVTGPTGIMPPSGMLPASDVENIRVFLACLE